ncbi:hypothetical protein OY671_010045, partial [Metschnikowia pulcherrima]
RSGSGRRRRLHRPVRGAGKRAVGRPQPARRCGMAAPEGTPEARPAGPPGVGQWRLFIQGLGLRARRHLRPHRDHPGRRQLPLPRPQSPAPGRRRRAGRAGPARSGAVRGAGGRRVRPGQAMAAAIDGAARAERVGQGLRHLRPAVHPARPLYPRRAGRVGAGPRGDGRGRRPARAVAADSARQDR